MVVSSHVLDEVERFGSRVLVMVQGRLAAEGDFRAHPRPDGRPPAPRPHPHRPAPGRGHRPLEAEAVVGVRARRTDGSMIVETTTRWPRFRHAVGRRGPGCRDAQLYEVIPLDDDLESVFRYLVGR